MNAKTEDVMVQYEFRTHRSTWVESTKEFYEQHKNDGMYQFRAIYTATVPLVDAKTRKSWEDAGGDFLKFSGAAL